MWLYEWTELSSKLIKKQEQLNMWKLKLEKFESCSS